MVYRLQSMVTSQVKTIDFIPDIPDLNPLNAIGDAIRGARDTLIAMVEQIIANPPRISDDASIKTLYQVALVPANQLSWAVFVFALIVSLLTFRAFGRIVYALIVMLIVVAVAPSYIFFMNELAKIGDSVTEAVSGIFTSQMSDSVSSIGNPLLDLMSFGGVVFWAYITTGFFVSADYAYTLMVFLIPLAFAVSAMGPRTRNVFNAFASIALVLALFGRPVAVLVLELFQGVSAVNPGSNAEFTENLLTAISFLIAVIIQLLLMIVSYLGINRVQGAIASRITSFQSQVKTSVTNLVRVRKDTSDTGRSLSPMPVIVVASAPSPRTEDNRSASTTIVNVGIAGAAAGAAIATRNPQTAAAVYQGGKKAQQLVKDGLGRR